MHDQHALGAEALHDAHQNADQVGVENTHQRVGRAGRVGQRTEDVEQGAHPISRRTGATCFMAL